VTIRLERQGERLVLRRPEWYVQTGSMFENPYGVPPDEIVNYVAENEAEVVAQVVFGKYVESSGLVFISDLINEMFDRRGRYYDHGEGVEDFVVRSGAWVDETTLEQARIQFRRQGRFNTRFFTGIDLARETDYTVIFTIDTLRLPARVVYYRRLNRVPWDTIYAEIGKAVHLFGPNALADSTGMGGDVVMDALESRHYCPKHGACVLNESRCTDSRGSALECNAEDYIPLSCVAGYEFGGGTGQRKKRLVEHLRNVLAVGFKQARAQGGEFGWLRCPPIPVLEEELAFYAWEDKRLMTDALFALALAVWHGLEDPVQDALIGSVMGD
jgi:hypothetical protein